MKKWYMHESESLKVTKVILVISTFLHYFVETAMLLVF